MNDGANGYFDGSADPTVEAPFATRYHLRRWYLNDDGHRQLLAQRLGIDEHQRRVRATDLDLGITAGFINFQPVAAGRAYFQVQQGRQDRVHPGRVWRTRPRLIWPDEK